MKCEYVRYGARTRELDENLSESDRRILEAFLQFCAMTSGPSRIVKYRTYLIQFRDVIEKRFDQITKTDAINFWGLVKAAPYTEHTKIDIRRSVKRFLKWQYRDFDLIEPLVIKRILVNKEKVNKRVLLSANELQRMLHCAERLRDKVLLVLLYETAARPQEIRNLKWGDIDWEEKEIHLYSGKTQSDRDLPVEDALQHLRRWKDEWVLPDPVDEDFVFPSTIGSRYNRSKAISVSYINRVIKALAQKAGLTRNVYSYLLRHSRLTEIRKRGVQGIEFNKFAGHSPGSRQENVYVHLDNSDMKRAIVDKVFKVQELKKSERQQYEDRILKLEAQMVEVLGFLGRSRATLQDVGDYLSVPCSAVDGFSTLVGFAKA